MTTEPVYTEYAEFSTQTIVVDSTESLAAAIQQFATSGGGTILVDGDAGSYILEGSGLGSTADPILIKPLDETSTPHFHQMNLNNSSFITVTGMHIDSGAIADTRDSWDYDVNVIGSNNIQIVGNSMESSAEGILTEQDLDAAGERAVLLRESQDINFSYNTIENYYNGLVYLEVQGLTITHNEISGIQGDGLRGGGIQDVVISNNYMHDFYGSTQSVNHSDMIQIWGTHAELLTQNVEISYNILDASAGAGTQSIFLRNEAFDETGYYSNISIHDNIIHNGFAQGIGASDTLNLEVYDNTILWNESAEYISRVGSDPGTTFPRIIIRNSPDAEVNSNIVGESQVNGETLAGSNYIITYTDETSPNYVGEHITNLSGAGDLSIFDLSILPDSPLYGSYGAAGSSLLSDENGSDIIVMRQAELDGNNLGVSFTAEYCLIDGAPINPDDTTVNWHFSDGTVAEGLSIYKVFDEPGTHAVELEVIKSDGQTFSVTQSAVAESIEIFDIGFNSGIADLSSFESALQIDAPGGDWQVAGRDGQAFHLDGDNKLLVLRENDQLHGLDTFKLDIGVSLDDTATTGTLAMLPKSFTLSVEAGGALRMSVSTDTGTHVTTSDQGVLADTDWHDISVVYDGPAGTLDILVDGELVGSGEASGYTPTTESYGFYLGAPWGATAEAAIDDLSMTAEPSSIYDGDTGPVDTGTGPVLEEPPVVEPPAEEPVEEPVVEPVEEPVEEPVAEDPPQETVAEDPVEEPVLQEPVAEEPVLQDPVVVEEPPEEETIVTTEPVETEKRGLAKMLDEFMEFIGKIFGQGGGNGKSAKTAEVEETTSVQSAEIILLTDIMPAVEDTANDLTDDSIGESDLDPMSMSM